VVPRVLIPWRALNPGCALSCSECCMRPCPQLLIQSLLLLGEALALADHKLEASVVGVLPVEGGDQTVAVVIDNLVGHGGAYSGDSLFVDSLLH